MNAVSMKGVSFNPQGGNGDCGIQILSPITETPTSVYMSGVTYNVAYDSAVNERILTEIFGSVPTTSSDLSNLTKGLNKIVMLPSITFQGEEGEDETFTSLILYISVSEEDDRATVTLEAKKDVMVDILQI